MEKNPPQPSILENITIATPCPADWNAMVGNQQVRFCDQCQLNVYNLSGMTREASEKLLLEHEGRVCVRFYQRPDGTVLTQDCPVGLSIVFQHKLKRKKAYSMTALKIAGAAVILLVSVAGAFTVQAKSTELKGEAVEAPQPQPSQTTPSQKQIPMMGAPVARPQNTDVPKAEDPQRLWKTGKPMYTPPNTPKKPCKINETKKNLN